MADRPSLVHAGRGDTRLGHRRLNAAEREEKIAHQRHEERFARHVAPLAVQRMRADHHATRCRIGVFFFKKQRVPTIERRDGAPARARAGRESIAPRQLAQVAAIAPVECRKRRMRAIPRGERPLFLALRERKRLGKKAGPNERRSRSSKPFAVRHRKQPASCATNSASRRTVASGRSVTPHSGHNANTVETHVAIFPFEREGRSPA
jgi:hypothetical protein